MKKISILFSSLLFFACSGQDGSDGTNGQNGSDAESCQIDVCEQNGWYRDGECDTFCPSLDPDC